MLEDLRDECGLFGIGGRVFEILPKRLASSMDGSHRWRIFAKILALRIIEHVFEFSSE